MVVRQQNGFRCEVVIRRPAAIGAALLVAVLLGCGLRKAVAEDKPVVTIRPVAPKAAPAAHAQPSSAAPRPTAVKPDTGARRRVASTRVRRRRYRHVASQPPVETPTGAASRPRTAARSERRVRTAARRPEPTANPVPATRTAAGSRRIVRSRVAGYRETVRHTAVVAQDRDETLLPRRRHARRVVRSEQTAPDAAAQGGGTGPVALNSRGHQLLMQGRYAEAEPYLRRAVALNPNYAYAQYNLGWSLLAQGKAAQSLGPLQHSAAQQPDRWEPQEKLAAAYRKLDDSARAQAAAARARALRRHGRSGKANPAVPAKRPVKVAARSAVDSGGWMGSTDRREQRFLTEWRALKLTRYNTGE